MPLSFAGALNAILAIGRLKNSQPKNTSTSSKPKDKSDITPPSITHNDTETPSPPLSFSKGFKHARSQTETSTIHKLQLFASRPEVPYFESLTKQQLQDVSSEPEDLYATTHHLSSTLLSRQGNPPDIFFNGLDPLPLLEIGVFIRLCVAKLSMGPDGVVFKHLTERLISSRLILKNSLEKARELRLLRETVGILVEGCEVVVGDAVAKKDILTDWDRKRFLEFMTQFAKDLEPQRLPQGKDRILGPAPNPQKVNKGHELNETLGVLRAAVQKFLGEAERDRGTCRPNTRQEFITLTTDVSP